MVKNYLRALALLLLIGSLTPVQPLRTQDLQKEFIIINRAISAGMIPQMVNRD